MMAHQMMAMDLQMMVMDPQLRTTVQRVWHVIGTTLITDFVVVIMKILRVFGEEKQATPRAFAAQKAGVILV